MIRIDKAISRYSPTFHPPTTSTKSCHVDISGELMNICGSKIQSGIRGLFWGRAFLLYRGRFYHTNTKNVLFMERGRLLTKKKNQSINQSISLPFKQSVKQSISRCATQSIPLFGLATYNFLK